MIEVVLGKIKWFFVSNVGSFLIAAIILLFLISQGIRNEGMCKEEKNMRIRISLVLLIAIPLLLFVFFVTKFPH
ncbi:hypothetical protein [Candidatus Uabimicrobium amorphum]|uniref:Uncharacterized protein n=1 Tax=Uabimicrobium amorphum TaxID=2596890 RepID=A0A5S9ITH5_UABAM|nr:hypothetical protein [Candidatus Uabimicrobium amorphum]BBM86850.1 hypothetical protein UABAM_05247 [Candidatus Uabimicrobium amorphum]